MEILRDCGVDIAFTTGEHSRPLEAPALEVPRFLIRATTGDARTGASARVQLEAVSH